MNLQFGPSARINFQVKYASDFLTQPPSILNIGCSDDPVHLGEWAHHYDMDDWSKVHKYFTQGDAHELPFPDQSFELVIMGDIIEHLVHPLQAMREAARVARTWVVMTIFEEWRLPGPGQWILEGQAAGEEASKALGYKDREDAQIQLHPKRVGIDDTLNPHLCHINQFTDSDIWALVVGSASGFDLGEYYKAFETVHESHPIFNWLISMRRSKT